MDGHQRSLFDYPGELYNGTAPCVAGSDTSAAAAEQITTGAGTLRERVRRYLVSWGAHGATDDEIEHALALRHQTASARRRELVLLGLVRDSGVRRRTRSGRNATVWQATR